MKNLIKVMFTAWCISLCACATAQNAVQNTPAKDETAEKMLIYQLSNGAWPKQLVDQSVVNYSKPIDEALMAKIKATDFMHATIDNKATSREVVALVKAYKATGNKNYLSAAQKGIDYLISAQYKNGGWPQYYPDKSSYRAEITYNDDAMVNVLNIMQDIATKTNDFEVVDASYISKAEDAVRRGIDCILKTQVVNANGKLTIWAAQYDQNTLKPAKARNFEPASLSTAESVAIVRFLMRFKNPSPAIKNAIANAIVWFEGAKIEGFKFDKMANGDKGLVADPSSTIWARFYAFDTNKPIFGDRDNSVKANVADISFERRNGYGWYGSWALNLITKDYPKWQKANP